MSNRSQAKTERKKPWLKQINPILAKLRLIHRRYIGRLRKDKDCGYWYGERPHVGFLAAAVWLAGGVALEEYGTRKIKNRGTVRGRADLYFMIDKTHFYCEAKHCIVTIGPKARLKRICDRLGDQPIDAGSRKVDYVLALCFATGQIEKSKPYKLWVSKMEKSLEEDGSTVAKWIGAKRKKTKEFLDQRENNKCPGFFLVMREIRVKKTQTRLQNHSIV